MEDLASSPANEFLKNVQHRWHMVGPKRVSKPGGHKAEKTPSPRDTREMMRNKP